MKSAVRGQGRRASLREAKPQPQAQESHFFTSQRRRLQARAAAGTRVSIQLGAEVGTAATGSLAAGPAGQCGYFGPAPPAPPPVPFPGITSLPVGPLDPTGKQAGEYFSRIISWFTKGEFTDELGVVHKGGHHYAWRHWEVLNEIDAGSPLLCPSLHAPGTKAQNFTVRLLHLHSSDHSSP